MILDEDELVAYFRYVTGNNGFARITIDDLMAHPELDTMVESAEELIKLGVDEGVVRKSFTTHVMWLAVSMWSSMRSHVGTFWGMTIHC